MGVIASQSRESKAWRAAIATAQIVIARRAKPDEAIVPTPFKSLRATERSAAIAFMVLSLKVFGESSKGVFPLLRTKAIAFMVLCHCERSETILVLCFRVELRGGYLHLLD